MKFIIKTAGMHIEHRKTYHVEGPLTNLDHPSKSPDVLPVAKAGVEPREIGCCAFVCHGVNSDGVDADGKKLVWINGSGCGDCYRRRTAKTGASLDSESTRHHDRV
jgi:hypothetical protein